LADTRRAVIRLYTCVVLAAFMPGALFAGVARQEAARVPGGGARTLRTLSVAVTDEKGNLVEGLRRDDFAVFDGKRRQELVSFGDANEPHTVGILLDASGSLFAPESAPLRERARVKYARLAAVKEAVSYFLANSHPSNEYFLVAFNESPQVLVESTTRVEDILSAMDRLAQAELKGLTALYDALYLALDKSARGRHAGRALLLVTDGDDTASKYRFTEVRRALRESDVTLYAVGLVDEFYGEPGGKDILEALAEISGGLALFPRRQGELSSSMAYVALEMRSRYTLGLVPGPSERKDGWHEIKIKLAEQLDPKGKKAKLRLRAREGFYGTPRPRGSS
jgi:Ca-activated chloride channel family protein